MTVVSKGKHQWKVRHQGENCFEERKKRKWRKMGVSGGERDRDEGSEV